MAYFRCGGGSQATGTATDAQVLTGYTFSNSNGVGLSGAMSNQGTKTVILNTTTTSYTIPEGYHSGSGTVSITTQSKNATADITAQTIEPDTNKVLSSVEIAAVSAKKTLTSSNTGSNVDMAGAYRYVDASAVYNQGKNDGLGEVYAIIGVSTNTPAFLGEQITVTDSLGTSVATATFDANTGFARIGVPAAGTYTFTVEYDDE